MRQGDPTKESGIEAEIRWGEAKRYAEDWLGATFSDEQDVVAAALLNLLAEREEITAALDALREAVCAYVDAEEAKEPWGPTAKKFETMKAALESRP